MSRRLAIPLVILLALPVPGVRAGEHPRLIFTAKDLPRLRERAKTPEGKAIIERCQQMLEKRFTTWNAAGNAFLYRVTGEQVWADRARDDARAMMEGKANPDARYHYARPNGQLRAGPVLGAMGLAYDLAYEGWDPEFRREVVENILSHRYTKEIVKKPRHHPGVNHWGAHSGGLGLALIAIRGDPELGDRADEVNGWLERILTHVRRELDEGFGPRGHYYEGHYCGRISANTGVSAFIQAARVALGVDLRDEHESARHLATKWIHELTRTGGKVRNIQRGMYARDPFTRGDQLSADGDFALGFGICPEELRPALLWTYNTIVEPDPSRRTYDIQEYPHLAAYALANWPIGVEPQNPAEHLPRILHDPGPGYLLFRNGWKGDDRDLLVTCLLGSKPRSGRGCSASGSVFILGHGVRYEFPGMFHKSKPVHLELDPGTGSGSLTAIPRESDAVKKKPASWAKHFAKEPTALAVDFTGKGGTELLVVMTGPQAGHVSFDCRGQTDWGGKKQGWHSVHSVFDRRGRAVGEIPSSLSAESPVLRLESPAPIVTHAVLVGGRTYYVASISRGKPLVPRPEGERVLVGDAKIHHDGQKLIIE